MEPSFPMTPVSPDSALTLLTPGTVCTVLRWFRGESSFVGECLEVLHCEPPFLLVKPLSGITLAIRGIVGKKDKEPPDTINLNHATVAIPSETFIRLQTGDYLDKVGRLQASNKALQAELEKAWSTVESMEHTKSCVEVGKVYLGEEVLGEVVETANPTDTTGEV